MDLISKEELVEYYGNLLKEYNSLLVSRGLDFQDYEEIISIVRRLSVMKHDAFHDWSEDVKHNKYLLDSPMASKRDKERYLIRVTNKRRYLDRIDGIMGGYVKISELLRKSVVPRSLRTFLGDHCSLAHLALTNNDSENKVYPYGMGNYMFLCQFHEEHTPSMSVNNRKGSGYCFGCGRAFNFITYLMQYEGLSYQEAINMIAKIYLIDLKNEWYSDTDALVVKYRNVLMSDEFTELINQGIEKTRQRSDTWLADFTVDKYNHDLETADRVRRGEHIFYSGKKPEKKVLILERPVD